MFYNGNYQSGVILSYEFLITNAGKVLMDKNIDAFYMSRYSTSYVGYSNEAKSALIFLDALFGLYFLFSLILYFRKMIRRFYKLMILRHSLFKFIDILDLWNLIMIFINIIYFSLVP